MSNFYIFPKVIPLLCVSFGLLLVANGNVDMHNLMEEVKVITGEYKVTINLRLVW